MSGNWAHRRIELSLSLGKGSFGDTGADTVTVKGLRIHALVQMLVNAPQQGFFEVYGLSRSMMNQLSTLGLSVPEGEGRKNTLTAKAGDDVNGMTEIFTGTIVAALQDYNAAPDNRISFTCSPYYEQRLRPVPATSHEGTVPAATILEKLAGQMGMAFTNNGVDAKVTDQYLGGSPMQQANTVVAAARINMVIDRGTMAIWPKKDGAYRDGAVAKISSKTGMIGYPTWLPAGLSCRTLFNPALVIGARAEVDTDLVAGTQSGTLALIVHDLQSETPRGKWETSFQVVLTGTGRPNVAVPA